MLDHLPDLADDGLHMVRGMNVLLTAAQKARTSDQWDPRLFWKDPYVWVATNGSKESFKVPVETVEFVQHFKDLALIQTGKELVEYPDGYFRP